MLSPFWKLRVSVFWATHPSCSDESGSRTSTFERSSVHSIWVSLTTAFQFLRWRMRPGAYDLFGGVVTCVSYVNLKVGKVIGIGPSLEIALRRPRVSCSVVQASLRLG